MTKNMENAVLDLLDSISSNRKKSFAPLIQKRPIIQAMKLDMIGFLILD